MTKTVEILIKIFGGIKYMPPSVPPRLSGKKHPYDRIGETVEIIKSEGKENQIFLSDESLASIKNDKKIHLCGDSKDYYVIHNPITNRPCFYRLVKVRTDRPWCINYSPAYGETIDYFDNRDAIEILDAELNYAKKIDEPR